MVNTIIISHHQSSVINPVIPDISVRHGRHKAFVLQPSLISFLRVRNGQPHILLTSGSHSEIFAATVSHLDTSHGKYVRQGLRMALESFSRLLYSCILVMWLLQETLRVARIVSCYKTLCSGSIIETHTEGFDLNTLRVKQLI